MKYPLIFIVGPTAVGKSRFALEAGIRFNAGIINADSVQVYQELNIGTAKPTVEERNRAPHYLFDMIPPGETYTAGRYRDDCQRVVAENGDERPLFLVGGSGFYIQAFDRGMYNIKPVAQDILEKWRRQLEELGTAALYEKLQELDPEYARKISSQDQYRIIRALTVIDNEGKSISQIQAEFARQDNDDASSAVKVKMGFHMDREALRDRVIERTELMIQHGLAEEVEGLLARGFGAWEPLSSVGYKETVAYLRGEYDRNQWHEEIVKNTMRLAKRQMTWFKRDKGIIWFDSQKGLRPPMAYLDSILEQTE